MSWDTVGSRTGVNAGAAHVLYDRPSFDVRTGGDVQELTYGLAESQAVLRAILESPKDIIIFALDRGYRYIAFNENHRRTIKAIWGVDIRVGQHMLDVIGREDDRTKAKCNFDRALAGESFTVIEEYGDERINRRYYEDVYSPIRARDGSVIGLTLYLTDITEQRQAELELERYRKGLEELVAQRTHELEAAHAQLLHAQKLESLGVMAGGIAHDFNNLLSVILGCADIAVQRRLSADAMLEQLERIQSAVMQARAVTDQLLAYSGKGKLEVNPVDVSAIAREMVDLIGITLPKGVRLKCELDAIMPAVEADAGQLKQVVMNLVTNAAESIAGRAGEVTLRSFALNADRALLDRCVLGESLAPGPYVCLEVADDGCGMDAEVQRKIFDPFFTSKFSGHGLGLAAVLGIVRGHRGGIRIESQVGRGTVFGVLLPATERRVEPSARGKSEPAAELPADALVLLVDDDNRVRKVLKELLELHGLRVVQACDGAEACERFRERAGEIAVVLLDVTMPGLSGDETLLRLREVRPDLEAILLSGYTEDEIAARVARSERVQFLHKPFQNHELVAALSRAFTRCSAT